MHCQLHVSLLSPNSILAHINASPLLFPHDRLSTDKLILTNAHVVRDFTTVRVRRHGGTDKTAAKVLCINDSCDLALITVEDDKFWDGQSIQAYFPATSLPLRAHGFGNIEMIF